VEINNSNFLKNLISYSFFNIIDKGLIFLGPFFLLFLTSNESLYNEVEYIFSTAAILVIFFDLGVKNYLFYGYKINEDKAGYLRRTKSQFNSLIILYLTIMVLIFLLFKELSFIIFFIFIRTILTLIINFYSFYFRLIDSPSKIFLFSIPINILVYIFTFYLAYNNIKITLFSFYSIPLISIIFFCIYCIRNNSLNFKLSNIISLSIPYAAPIMINLFFVSIINHFGKIYAYNLLDSSSMFEIASLQRISTIISLFHVSLVGFFSKQLFTSKIKREHQKIFLFYIVCLIVVAILILFLSQFFNYFLQINNTALLFFIIGTLLWSVNSYFEVYFNANNVNKYIPLISFGSFFIYFIIFFNLNIVNATNLSFVYFFSNLSGFLLVMFFLKRIKNHGILNLE